MFNCLFSRFSSSHIFLFSPAAGPQHAEGGGGSDGGHAGRAAGRGDQLAPVSGGGAAEVGHHLPEGPLPHHHGHQRQAALRAHLRYRLHSECYSLD